MYEEQRRTGMKKERRVVLIGLDALSLDITDRFVKEGLMPNMERLMENGFTAEAFPSLPPGTAMNWTTIATGAHVGTHGVPAMTFRKPGEFFSGESRSAFYSDICLAEKIYETAEKCNKSVILLKYPTSWPPTIKKGVQIDGFGDPGWNVHDIAPRLCFSTYPLECSLGNRKYIAAYLIKVGPCRNWIGLANGEDRYFEAKMEFSLTHGGKGHFFALIDRDAHTVTLFLEKNVRKPLATMRRGEWSNWLEVDFDVKGEEKKGVFRAKLMEHSDGGETLKVYTTRIMSKHGWTYPESLSGELYREIGPYQELSAIVGPYNSGWVDEKTVLEETEYQSWWLGATARHLMAKHRWDLMMTQWHGIDHMGHLFLGGMDPKCIYYDIGQVGICTEAMRKTYALADRLVGDILTNVDENTVVCVVSDHGMIGVRTRGINIDRLLSEHGINEPNKVRARRYGESFIVINLEGREKNGCVPKEEYEALRNEIIKLLEEECDSETGERIMQVVLKREDARIFGIYGERVGDIVFFLKTEYSRPLSKIKENEEIEAERGLYEYTRGEHHAFFPSGSKGVGSIMATAVFSGPEIRKGVRRRHPIQLIDIAPTIAHILGIKVPAQSEGSILYEMFERE